MNSITSNILLLSLFVLIALFSNVARCGENHDPAQSPLMNACKDHSYETHLISEDPLVIYIDGFISQEEALQLVSLRCPLLPSPISLN
jgi:prolyl 4-hydroxylase